MLLVCVTFPLISVGGLVTTYDAGMAVEDWPTTYGYNLFLYPWQEWIFGPFDLFIEHKHRLLGGLAGIISIALVAVSFWFDRRPAVRWGAVGALLLVILQGLLGGFRVLLDDRTLALIHGCVGPAFFAYVTVFAAVTSRWWKVHEGHCDERARGLQRLALATLALAYFQLVIGAHVRHIEPGATADVFRVTVLFHIATAFVLAGHAVVLAWKMRARDRVLRRPARAVATMVVLQILLGAGVWVVNYGWPFLLSESLSVAGGTVVAGSRLQAFVTTSHVALGSLIIATSALVAARSLRFFRTGQGVLAGSSLQWGVAR